MTLGPNARLEVHPEALAEAEAARDWYAERSVPASRAFLAELDHAMAQIAEFPRRWPRFQKGTRRYLFPRFPFSLIYRLGEQRIEVMAVAHHRRKPGYWSRRL